MNLRSTLGMLFCLLYTYSCETPKHTEKRTMPLPVLEATGTGEAFSLQSARIAAMDDARMQLEEKILLEKQRVETKQDDKSMEIESPSFNMDNIHKVKEKFFIRETDSMEIYQVQITLRLERRN